MSFKISEKFCCTLSLSSSPNSFLFGKSNQCNWGWAKGPYTRDAENDVSGTRPGTKTTSFPCLETGMKIVVPRCYYNPNRNDVVPGQVVMTRNNTLDNLG